MVMIELNLRCEQIWMLQRTTQFILAQSEIVPIDDLGLMAFLHVCISCIWGCGVSRCLSGKVALDPFLVDLVLIHRLIALSHVRSLFVLELIGLLSVHCLLICLLRLDQYLVVLYVRSGEGDVV